MQALQYIYTSWKNGTSQDKGYMIYAKSAQITDVECDEIKFAMQYMAPKGLVPNPTQDEIANDFPYNFAYFKLSTGRVCVSQATYLGKDYSGRFGNYIISALLMPEDELVAYPTAFFGEPCLKTSMTQQELDAPSPVPALPPLGIDAVGSVVNDALILEFVAERETEFATLLSMVLHAKEEQVPFYLNDTRENLVMWMAALQHAFPLAVAKEICFATYVGNHDKFRFEDGKSGAMRFACLGVRPDANYFDMRTEAQSNRQVVLDFLDGNMTPNIPLLDVANALAESYTFDMDEIASFGGFLGQVGYTSFDKGLEAAYHCYQLLEEKEQAFQEAWVAPLVVFALRYCTAEQLPRIGVAILKKLEQEEWRVSLKTYRLLLPFLYQAAPFMQLSIHEMLYHQIYDYLMVGQQPQAVDALLQTLHKYNAKQYLSFLSYFVEDEVIAQSLLYLKENPQENVLAFYAAFMAQSFDLSPAAAQPRIKELFCVLVENIAQRPSAAAMLVQLCDGVKQDEARVFTLLKICCDVLTHAQAATFAKAFAQWMDERSIEQQNRIKEFLLCNCETVQFGVHLCKMHIEQSKDVEKAFWSFYQRQYPQLRHQTSLRLDEPVDIYLRRAADPQMACLQLLEKFDLNYLGDEATVQRVLNALQQLPIKTVDALPDASLAKVLHLATAHGYQQQADHFYAVAFGKACQQKANAAQMRRIPFAQQCAGCKAKLARYQKKEYRTYLAKYFDGFFDLLRTEADFAALFAMCFHQEYLEYFHEAYQGALKQAEKKEKAHWLACMVATALYLMHSVPERAIAVQYQPLFAKLLRRCDETQLTEIKKAVVTQCGQASAQAFFDSALEKEKITDKMGGFFKRKK